MSVFNNAFSSVWKPTFGSVWDVPSSPLIEITLGPEYSWFPYKVYYNSETNEFESSYNFDAAKPTGGTTYYLTHAGSDSNDGLTPATGFATLSKLLSASNIGEGVIEHGEWNMDNTQVLITNLQRDISLRSDTTDPVWFLGYKKGISWVPSPTVTNAYETANASTTTAWDNSNLDTDNKAKPLAVAPDAASVGTTLDSMFVQIDASFTGVIAATTGILTASAVTGTITTGTVISGQSVPYGTTITSQLTGTTGGAGTYQTSTTKSVPSTNMRQGKTFVRLFDDRTPDDNVWLMQPTSFIIRNNNTASSTIWMDNIKFRGVRDITFRVISATYWLTVHARGLDIEYNDDSAAAYEFLGTDSYLVNCKGYQSLRDMFSWHYSGRKTYGFDIDCYAKKCGVRDTVNTNNNAFTGHDGGSFISINAVGLESRGPNFAYVHGGTNVILFNPYGAFSARPTGGNDFTSGQGQGVNPAEPGSTGGSIMRIIEGKSEGSVYNLICDNGIVDYPARIYLYSFDPASPTIFGASANVKFKNSAQEAATATD